MVVVDELVDDVVEVLDDIVVLEVVDDVVVLVPAL